MPEPETLGAHASEEDVELEADSETGPFIEDHHLPKDVEEGSAQVQQKENLSSGFCAGAFRAWFLLSLVCSFFLLFLFLYSIAFKKSEESIPPGRPNIPNINELMDWTSSSTTSSTTSSTEAKTSRGDGANGATTGSFDQTTVFARSSVESVTSKLPRSWHMPELLGPLDRCKLREPAEKLCGNFSIPWTPPEGSSGNRSFVAVHLEDGGGHRGAQFGNQLFTAAVSVIHAVTKKKPLLVLPSDRQLNRLPCLRSSQSLNDVLLQICQGCQKERLWCDRNSSCNGGRGCRDLFQIISVGGGYHQNLAEWGPDHMKWRETFQSLFYAPLPQLEVPVRLPGPSDLVMHFRSYDTSGKVVFERRSGRIYNPPFGFFKWAADHFRTVHPAGKIWIVADPRQRLHPTTLRLQKELGAEVYREMDQFGKQAWVGDFAFLRSASYFAMSPSTFSWWAAFLSDAKRVYFPIPPGRVPLPWCRLCPEDPRYLFYDLWNNESISNRSFAQQRCAHLDSKQPIFTSGSKWVFRLYPELVENLDNKTLQWLQAHSSN